MIQFVPHKRAPITKVNRLMLYRETIVVYCEKTQLSVLHLAVYTLTNVVKRDHTQKCRPIISTVLEAQLKLRLFSYENIPCKIETWQMPKNRQFATFFR
jgi:hypothetical protein